MANTMEAWAVISLLLAIAIPTNSAPMKQCACASVDTYIERTYGLKDNGYGTLESPNCLPYNGDQAAINDGRIYAHVSYNTQSAWLLTSDIYIKDCNEQFNCVCATEDTLITGSPSSGNIPMQYLSRGKCRPLANGVSIINSTSGTWVSVSGSQEFKYFPGWINKKYLIFHHNCGGANLEQSSISHQQPTNSPQLPGCPQIITRAEWGARPPVAGIGTLTKTPYYAFIHHGATAGCDTREECVKMIQSYQNYHMDGHGWNDIGYSFVVGEDGNVYEARGWDQIGAHTLNYNSVGLGFCVIGNFMQRVPNQAAQEAVKKIIECGVANSKLTSTYTLLGHRDTNSATACPGDQFYALIKNWDHFNSTVIPS